MDAQEIRRRLDESIRIDDCQVRVYLNIHTAEDAMAITVHDTEDDARQHKQMLIDSLVEVLS
jgi:hypothetical protein